jgi:RHS repeat-associated protein
MPRKVCCLFMFLFICSAFPSLIHADNQTVFGPKSFEIGKWHVHASVHTFNGEDPGEGIVTVTKNTPDKPISGGFILFNTTLVPLHDFLVGDELVFEKGITLRSINFITVFLRGTPGASVTIEVNKEGGPIPPPEVSFSADPQTITLGGSSTLTWNSTYADTCEIDQGVGSVTVNGSMSVSPTETTTYTLTAVGLGGTTTQSVTITVNIPLPTVSISANPETILLGESSTLSWSSTHADTCEIDQGVGSVTVNGSMSVSPTETTTYTITATGPGGTALADVTITVTNPNAPPAVTMTPASADISQGDSITLTWNSQRAQSAFIDNGVGSVPLNGSTTVSPDHTTTYTITVTGPTGSNSAASVVRVIGSPEPLPEGSFGKQYEDLIPTDATVDEYDTKRFSLITGRVRSIDDTPISNVSVTLHSHPEYGTVSTDAQGRFSLPVEGGTTLTVVYQKNGFITAHRKVYVPWNNIAIAETIRMIAEDPISTTVIFDGNPDTVVTHQSTEVTDEFGSRSCSMVFTGDNHAYLVDENGNDVQELTTITTRATEYTTPESMPAVLPPTSAYTYCVELSVDGAERVRFEKPVITWVDNFLGFDVGEIVPVGYYDRDRGFWIPSDNGVVVKLLDTDTDGIVDALDADGDNQPDDLNSDGSCNDEVTGLGDAGIYQPDSTYWRVAVTHFTPGDCNWPFRYPEDAIYPNPENEPDDEQPENFEICLTGGGSSVEDRSRIFHENIPIPGTDMALHYTSNRVEGYNYVISIPVIGSVVPVSLKRIIVKVEVAGRTLTQILDPQPDQIVEFNWDGLDYLGRHVSFLQGQVSIGFVYNAEYLVPGDYLQAFGQTGRDPTWIPTRQEITLWKKSDIFVGTMAKEAGVIAEGWSLTPHHYLNPIDPSRLYKGGGTISTDAGVIIDTVAGNGTDGYSGDGGPAVDARLYIPEGVTVDASGNFYIVDRGNHCIRKVDTSGIITTVAGTGTYGYSGDGGPAVDAQLHSPTDVVLDKAGNLYIADLGNHRIRKIDNSGMITTVVEALYAPHAVALDNWGNLYILDLCLECGYIGSLRKMDQSGTITTIMEIDPDHFMSGLCVDSSGNIYIADTQNHRIIKLDTTGMITTVVGNGTGGYSGDGGPATQAQLDWPTDVDVNATGDLYITDTSNHCIRKVDTLGNINSIAGYGVEGYSGDGGPASRARLESPEAAAVDATGDLYIADSDNHRIRKVAIPYVLAGVITGGEHSFTEKSGVGHIITDTGLHKKTIDLNSGLVLREFGYDENNKLDSMTDRFGNQTTIERDGNGVPISMTSPDGLTTTFTIDATNHLTRITYPDSSYYSFEYTPDGLLTAKVEPEGNRFEHVFDSKGKLTDTEDEEGGHWQFSKTAYSNGDILSEVLTGEGNLTSYLDHTYSAGAFNSTITGPTGAQTLFARSNDGLTVNKTLPCGTDLEFKYDLDSEYSFKYIKEMTETMPSSVEKITLREKTYQDTNSDYIPDLITETVTVNGKSTTLENNVLQSQKTITSPEGRTVTTLYDPETLVTESMSIPGLFETAYGYDTRGRLTSTSTNTRQTTFAYNGQGFLESVTDPEKHTTTYTYDPVGRITGINRPDTTSIGFAYDNNGNMTVLTNPSTIDHGFGFNKVNRNTSYQTPLSGSYNYVYDKDRRLKQTNFPSGNQINNIYANGRLERIQTPEGNIDFTYVCGTKVDSITKGTEAITYGYDGKLVTSETMAGTLSQSLGYAYNKDFNLTGFTYAGNTTNYLYDNDGLLTGAGSFTIARNAQNGLPESVTGGPLNLSRFFNGYGEVEGQTFTVNSQSLTSWNLIRDDNGRIIQKTETVGGASSDYIYTYDSMGRLLTVTKDGALVEEYQYSSNGARTFEMNSLRNIAGRTFTYSDEDHLLTAGTTTYQYNVDGFLTTKTQATDVTTYDYSSRGELLSVMLPDGRLIEYVYDPLDRRIAKKVNGTITEKYLWQDLTRLLAVYDGSDNLLMRFEYADGRMPVAMTKDGVTYFLTYDQVGSIRIVADASGNVVKRVDYDSFGNIIGGTNLSFEVPFGFAGGLHDRDTGLVRFGYRDYDPDIGRWTAKDPILFAGGDSDLYGYCINDPINWVDPLGLDGVGESTTTLPDLPSWSDFFPESDFVAPVADIITGGLEAGWASACGLTAGIAFFAGPEFWWLSYLAAPNTVGYGWDAFTRIKGGIERLNE